MYTRKEREDVFGGEKAWDDADKTKIQCPKEGCDGDEAAFYQVQIRSADEPMTGFYKVSFGGGCGCDNILRSGIWKRRTGVLLTLG